MFTVLTPSMINEAKKSLNIAYLGTMGTNLGTKNFKDWSGYY